MEGIVDIHLDIDDHDSVITALVQFYNNSKNEIHLDTRTMCIGNMTTRNVFNITDEKNNKIDYIGVLVNREVVPEDFIELKAGEKIETKIVLNEVYKIAKGHKYYIQYSVFHPTYMDDAGFEKLESNKVEVVY